MNNLISASIDGSRVLGINDTVFTCVMGITIVFVGLISIVIICSLMSLLLKNTSDKESETAAAPSAAPAVQASSEPIANRQEFIAAVSAAIAEDMGKDVSAIRITDVKRI